jgi:hypothetical protein
MERAMTDQTTISVTLDRDEALALFAFLAREIDDADAARLRPLAQHDGELWSLNGLYLQLERALAEPFAGDYADRVTDALGALVERRGSWPA